jgi:hypothetical protein
MIASLGQDLLHPVFLPHIPLAEELDLDPAVGRQPFGVLAKLVPERLCELRVVEDPDLSLVQIRGHSLRVADLRQRAEDQHPIPATQYSRDLMRVPFR